MLPVVLVAPPIGLIVPDHVTVTAGRVTTVTAIVVNRSGSVVRNVVLNLGAIDPSLRPELPAACSATGCLVGELAPGASRTFTFTLGPAVSGAGAVGGGVASAFEVTAGGPGGALGAEARIAVNLPGAPAPTGPGGQPATQTPALSTAVAPLGGTFRRETARIGVRNLGSEPASPVVRVSIPAGVRLTAVDDECLPVTATDVLDLATAGTVDGSDYTCFVRDAVQPGAIHLFGFTGELTGGSDEPGAIVIQGTGAEATLAAAGGADISPSWWVALGGALSLVTGLYLRRRGKPGPKKPAAVGPIPIQVVPDPMGAGVAVPAMRQGAAPPDIISFGAPRRVPRPRRR